MSYVKLKDISSIHFALLEKSTTGEIVKTVSPVGLLENNVIEIKEENVKIKKNDIVLKQNDIIIKRISPNYVNVLDRYEEELLLFNNALAIRIIDDNYISEYVAHSIEQQLPHLLSEADSGTFFTAINRKLLEEINIVVIDKDEQIKIGHLWRLGNKKQILLKQLLRKEQERLKAINKKLQSKVGGDENG